jgi:hypothetical protein
MMSYNRRSAQVINDHLPIEEVSREYSSDRRNLEKMAAIIQKVKYSVRQKKRAFFENYAVF